eukprot:TRINITY_DN69_c0_g1_i1.p1 TRINITY_DN69_c0_g1~~TRINITY_DN69_c0_g1_i1.p1  ORF type:complete len:780 (+),score=218.89 TRINITY_DN69_c0_g1_i1:72-2411(+)
MNTSMQRSFDFNANWEKIHAGLCTMVRVCQGVAGPDEKITTKEYQDLYFFVYSWCTRPEEKKKQELYEKVAALFQEVVEKDCVEMKGKSGDILLKDYLQRFTNFTSATNMIKNIFAYMQRYYIPSQMTNGDGSVRPIFELSLVKWRDFAFEPLKAKLLQALLVLVTAERDGEKVDKTLLSNMVQAYIKIGVPPVDNPVNFYKKEFQEQFIKDTKEYYIKESDSFIQSNSISAYMQKAEGRIIQEEALSQTYLHPSTKPDLTRACEEVLIERHNQQLQDEFQKMLRDDKSEDMRRFYYLLSRIPNGLNRSAETMKQFLTVVGTGIVTDHSAKLTQRAQLKDSSPLILDLLALHKKYSDILKRCMSESKLFSQALDEAFTVFINKKAGIFLMSEVLNNYVDGVMTGKERLADDQIYEQLDSVVRLFTYFNDKDVFYDAFRRGLSKRLLLGKIQEEWERHFLQRLKITCGDVYTKKLEGMFNDVKISNEQYVPQFKEWCDKKSAKLGVDMAVTVLNDSYWPTTSRTALTPTQEFNPCIKAFEDFYRCQEEKKILVWLYQSGDVLLNYAIPGKGKPTNLLLNVSVMQATICLLFNQQKEWRFKDIMDTLGTNEELLKWSITPLLYTKDRVFTNKGTDGKGKPKGPDGKPLPITWDSIVMEDLIGLVPLRTPKKKIPYPPGKPLPKTGTSAAASGGAAANKTEDEENLSQLLRERELKMQLALVRVMKARNTLQQQQLIAEASTQLEKFFMPDPRLMKKQIEVLMERGFMRRDADDQRKIHYCA